jgi:hypothetical protein
MTMNCCRHAVDLTITAFIDGLHSARQDGWCVVCDAPIRPHYLPDETIQTQRLTQSEIERRRQLDRRVSVILSGGVPT